MMCVIDTPNEATAVSQVVMICPLSDVDNTS